MILILSIRDAMAIGGSIARSRSRLQLSTKLTLQAKPPQSLDQAIGLDFGTDHMQHIPSPQNQSLEAIYLSLPTGSTVKLPKPIFRGSAAVRPTAEQEVYNSHDIRYWVSEKTDGTRYVLFVEGTQAAGGHQQIWLVNSIPS